MPFYNSGSYHRDYYWAYRDRMKQKSLECYYKRKEINNTNPKKEYENILKLFQKKSEKS